MPRETYRHIYPAHVDLDRIAHAFDYEFVDALPDEAFEPTFEVVRSWHATWERRPVLTFTGDADRLTIVDTRAGRDVYTVVEPLASVYAAMSDRPRNVGKVAAELGLDVPIEELTAALDEFCAWGLMVREGDAFLSLALPVK